MWCEVPNESVEILPSLFAISRVRLHPFESRGAMRRARHLASVIRRKLVSRWRLPEAGGDGDDSSGNPPTDRRALTRDTRAAIKIVFVGPGTTGAGRSDRPRLVAGWVRDQVVIHLVRAQFREKWRSNLKDANTSVR